MNQPARMPPRMTNGAASPHDASRRLGQKAGRGIEASFAPILCFLAIHTAGTISATPASTPGIMPAANSAGTEAPGTITE